MEYNYYMIDYYSYSRLSDALKCERYFQYLYVDKLEVPRAESMALSFGTAIHAACEEILTQGSSDSFDAILGSLQLSGEELEPVLKMGHSLLNTFRRTYAPRIKPVSLEQTLKTTVEGINIEGTPDVVGYFDGVPSIIDYKTASQRYSEDAASCSDQLVLYAYLAMVNKTFPDGDIPKQIVYLPFIKTKSPYIQTPVIVSITTQFILDRVANIIKKCHDLNGKDYYHQNFGSCIRYGQRCPAWDMCHSKKKEE